MTVLRLRPDLPLCWEDPDTLRLGFDRAVARVRHPSAAQQRLLGRLRAGVPEPLLPRTIRDTGATPQEARALVAALGPALTRTHGTDPGSEPSGSPVRVYVSDRGRAVAGFHRALTASGELVLASSPQESEVIAHIERFLEPLERPQAWLQAGLPHFLVRFSDSQFSVGPLVLPRGQPCHTCVALTVLAQDAALPALAAQLVDAHPASETPLTGALAGSIAASLLAAWWRAPDSSDPPSTPGSPSVPNAPTTPDSPSVPSVPNVSNMSPALQLTCPVTDGRVAGPPRVTRASPHPECACGELNPAATEARAAR